MGRHINTDDGTFDIFHEQTYTIAKNKLNCLICDHKESKRFDEVSPRGRECLKCGHRWIEENET